MNVTFLTPIAGLVALLGLVPLAVLFAVSDHATRVRHALGVDQPTNRRTVTAIAIGSIAVLVGLATAQPLLAQTQTQPVRSDAEALFVIDTSRSMLASTAPLGPTRIDRAKQDALSLRAKLPDVPVGVASLTDRTLPHLFPNADEQAFRATVEQAIDIEQPPPIAYLRTGVTTMAALTAVVTRGFFSPTASHRVLVVFTDGESRPFDAAGLGAVLRRGSGVRARLRTRLERGTSSSTRTATQRGATDPTRRATRSSPMPRRPQEALPSARITSSRRRRQCEASSRTARP